MLEGKANMNKGSRNAPLVCYCVWREDVAAPFSFLFKADTGSSGFILLVCFMKCMLSEEYVVPEEQRWEQKEMMRKVGWFSSCTIPQM